MNKTHNLMVEYYKKIKLSESKKNDLRNSRNIIRENIKKYFKDLDEYNIPKFYIQGSMAMGTTIKPLNDEFDIDDGVYLDCKDIDYDNMDSWPTPEKAHKILKDACSAYNRTVIDKKNCIRVVYANNYHIDFPIYIKNFQKDGIPYLATKDGWIKSDPLKNTQFYLEHKKKYGEVLTKMIVYLKAIKDNYCHKNETKIPLSGFEITLFCCNALENIQLNQYDQTTLDELLVKIINKMENNEPLLKPTTNEDLWSEKDYSDKEKVIEFIKKQQEITKELNKYGIKENIRNSLLNELFGDRICIVKNKQLCEHGSLDHRQKLPWEFTNKIQFEIKAKYSNNKNASKRYDYKQELLNKCAQLFFKAHINEQCANNCEIKWQITNTGKSAADSKCLRGGYVDSNGSSKLIRTETTAYRGSHIVQAFAVQDEKCIGKSNEIIVNIR